MNMLTLAVSAWIRRQHAAAVLAVAAGALIGWPFCALAAAPIALELIWIRGLGWFISISLIGLVGCMVAGARALPAHSWQVPSVLVDWSFYRRPVAAVLNILRCPETGCSAKDWVQVQRDRPGRSRAVRGGALEAPPAPAPD